MTSRTASRKRAAAGTATQPRQAPKSAPLDAGRRVQRRGMRRNRHRATRAENRIARFHRGAISPGRPQRSRSRALGVAAGRIEVIAWETGPTTMRWPPVRDTPKGERRTRKHEDRVVDLKSDHAGPGPQVTPKNSPNILQWCKRHTMGEFAPDGRYCFHPIVARGGRPANGHHCQRSLSIAAERQGTTRKTRPAACRPGFRQSIRGRRLSAAVTTASRSRQPMAAWYFSTTSDGTRPRADTEMPCA